MKRILFIIAIFALTSCAKEYITAPESASVTFNVGNITTGTMTKGVPELLSATAPSGPFSIKLTSTTNASRTYTITTGVATNIILDTYAVLCKYYPSKCTEFFRSKVYLEPCFEIRTEVTITEETTSVNLTASYTCFALAINTETTDKYSIYALGTETELTDIATNGIVYVYVTSAWNSSGSASLYSYPIDTANYETTIYPLCTQATADHVLVENGKWYVFNPNAADAVSGTLGVSFPEWTEGATE